VLFPQLEGKYQGITRKERARPALFPFYVVNSSLILVWPLRVRIPESLPTKVLNCVVLCVVCKCVLCYCHRVATQLQLTNITVSISISVCTDWLHNTVTFSCSYIIIIIIIIIILVITFIHGIYNYTPETNHISRSYSVGAVWYLQFVLHVMLFRPWNKFCPFTLALSYYYYYYYCCCCCCYLYFYYYYYYCVWMSVCVRLTTTTVYGCQYAFGWLLLLCMDVSMHSVDYYYYYYCVWMSVCIRLTITTTTTTTTVYGCQYAFGWLLLLLLLLCMDVSMRSVDYYYYYCVWMSVCVRLTTTTITTTTTTTTTVYGCQYAFGWLLLLLLLLLLLCMDVIMRSVDYYCYCVWMSVCVRLTTTATVYGCQYAFGWEADFLFKRNVTLSRVSLLFPVVHVCLYSCSFVPAVCMRQFLPHTCWARSLNF